MELLDIRDEWSNPIKKFSYRDGDLAEEEMVRLAAAFSEAGSRHGIAVRTCCEKVDLSRYGISHASCIDQRTIESICGYSIDGKRDINQRSGCGCIQSIDIGSYNTCGNGCIYCYANTSEISARRNQESHDPSQNCS